jgi:hypothetical protein
MGHHVLHIPIKLFQSCKLHKNSTCGYNINIYSPVDISFFCISLVSENLRGRLVQDKSCMRLSTMCVYLCVYCIMRGK